MRLWWLAALSVVGLLGCGTSDTGEETDGEGECVVDTSYDPFIDPAAFSSTIDNPLSPFVPGTKYVYVAGDETVEVAVTSDTKVVLGVTCVVVHDQAFVGGEVIEDTYDWYAQHSDGSVWYFGEDTKELSGGKVTSTAGSWEGGVDGAKPGIIIPAVPAVGKEHQQEYYACEAEDKATVLDVNASASVPFGDFTGCMKTHDFTPLDPDVNEEKTYCPGVGLVLTVHPATGEREELSTVTP